MGTQIALQLIGLRYGVDAMVPRAPRPNRAADIPLVVKVVMDNRGLLLDAVPNAATEGDLARMKEDNERLDFITRARANMRILDRGLEAVVGRPNWQVTVLPTGALPFFEVPAQFNSACEAFLAAP